MRIFKKAKFRPYKILYLSLIILEIFNISQHLLYLKFISKNKDFSAAWGASFSAPYARSFGLDPKAVLESTLKDFNFNQIRLMSFWEDVQAEGPEQFNFSELDWQLNLVESYGKKATVALGLRQPRWPECHEPEWAKQMNYSAEWESKLNDFITKTVERYKNRSSVVSWQLENESKLKTFGDCDELTLNPPRIEKEFQLVKSLDSTRPVIMSTSDQYGLPIKKPTPDLYGFSIYKTVTVPEINIKFNYPQQPIWHGARAELINLIQNKDVFIHELQCEPWGNKPIDKLTIDEQNETMGPAQLKYNLNYARAIGTKQIDVWGVEWWYWRQIKFNDSSILDAAKTVING